MRGDIKQCGVVNLVLPIVWVLLAAFMALFAADEPHVVLANGGALSTYAYDAGAHSAQEDTEEAVQRSGQERGEAAEHHATAVVAPLPAARHESVAAKTVDEVLATPQVASPKLQNIVNDLYKGTTNPERIGNGTMMYAIANELKTGLPTAGKFHSIKGQDSLNGLNNWLARNPSAPYQDRLVAQSLADELSAVLGGVG